MDVFGSEVKVEGVAVSESVETSDANRKPVARLGNSVQISDISQTFNNLYFDVSLALITSPSPQGVRAEFRG